MDNLSNIYVKSQKIRNNKRKQLIFNTYIGQNINDTEFVSISIQAGLKAQILKLYLLLVQVKKYKILKLFLLLILLKRFKILKLLLLLLILIKNIKI